MSAGRDAGKHSKTPINLRILSPHEVLTLSSDDLGNSESITIGERPYQIIQATDMPRGSLIEVELTGLPKQNVVDKIGQAVESVRLEFAVSIALALLMTVVTMFAIRRRRQQDPLLAIESSNAEQERRTVQHLISGLETEFNAGSVSEDDYRRRRRILEFKLISTSEK